MNELRRQGRCLGAEAGLGELDVAAELVPDIDAEQRGGVAGQRDIPHELGIGAARCLSLGGIEVHAEQLCLADFLAVEAIADGRHVETIEGLSDSGELTELQAAFLAYNAFQCGFCASGMLITALDIVRHHREASRDEIRELISGNYCRCTGYQSIVDAIESVLKAHRLLPPQSLSQGAAS